MNLKYNTAFYTIIRREFIRMLRISSQVFLPAVITTALYFLIFGTLIGKRIGDIDRVSYSLFIAPGLIMMSVITNSYGNVSTSLFSSRFQKNIEELLVSPIPMPILLFGYITGGLIRGTIVALLVFIVANFFVHMHVQHILLSILVILLVAGIFSLAGFSNALYAKTFDEIMLVPTFLLTPLTYLGGIFYSTNMLSPIWQKLSHLNPIWYMVNALRYAIIGSAETNIYIALIFMSGIFVSLIAGNLILLNKGIGLKE
ncbi:MAG: ABC transporter permease [Legionellales bacterium RIFCSPHIGHO2_12_FULL_37_14]|nr:MAG: ABC transporter permease [Legionellales bacterium RIFCSPHIGHO2_12_FULL_37_14]